jgi:hypothetical protein
VSERTITLTTGQLADLRGKGQTYDRSSTPGDIVRLLRDSSGYRPLPGATNQIVLSNADLDLIEQQPEGLVVADTTGTTGWTMRMEVTQ